MPDDDTLEELVRLYHDRVYRFGVRACRDAFDADDAVQEAFVRLGRRPDVQRHPAALAWLLTTVRNACLRLLRPFARQRRQLGELVDERVEIVDGALTPEEALARQELVHAVHAALLTLPRWAREVVVLRDLEGRSGVAVSAAFGITEEAMKSRLHRARRLVREALDQRFIRRHHR